MCRCDPTVASSGNFLLCNEEHLWTLLKNFIDKANKKGFSHTGCPKNQNGLISVHKLSYMDRIKELGLLKKFTCMIRQICEAFFSKDINQTNEMLF